jgi:hypothetical protein
MVEHTRSEPPVVSDEFLPAARSADVRMSFVCGRESVLGYLSFNVSELLKQPTLTRTSPDGAYQIEYIGEQS